MKKWVAIIAGGLLALIAVAYVVGVTRPKSHEARTTFVINRPDSVVWAEIAAVEKSPEWVPDIRGVERLPDRDGKPSYKENFGGFEATTVVTLEPPRRMVKDILPTGPFYGSWTWELAPDSAGTRLTIIERGTVDNALLRAMMIFNDNEQSMRDYAAALGRRLGANVEEVR